MENNDLVITPRKPRKLRGEDGYKVFSIRIREEIVAKLDDISEQTGRSRNQLIAMFIEYALDHCVIDTGANG